MITLNAVHRYGKGTHNSRYMRKVHCKIPGIIYGKEFLEKELLILLEHDIVFNLQKNSNFFSQKLLINLDKKKFCVIVKDIQYHAFKSILLHIDFLYVNENI
ncbi:50S ribosomal protein L25 [Buchnera aphidicola (Cinara cuneomaculata)]|uniref:50S ribosomal protein L25 n=1 Tax=Buchnera aphidicola (Cinara cuneomaculata) TaxID=1660040 RepID=A0A451CXU1_9GAMM|nr:50S ribosomal protein L25 [Buchnera aphidicola]VFP78073.1 50S ribosomal protein L25 [Buchnera aphidicola (Cinara cuneomaculata)]